MSDNKIVDSGGYICLGGSSIPNDGKHLRFMNLPAVTVGPTFQINLICMGTIKCKLSRNS